MLVKQVPRGWPGYRFNIFYVPVNFERYKIWTYIFLIALKSGRCLSYIANASVKFQTEMEISKQKVMPMILFKILIWSLLFLQISHDPAPEGAKPSAGAMKLNFFHVSLAISDWFHILFCWPDDIIHSIINPATLNVQIWRIWNKSAQLVNIINRGTNMAVTLWLWYLSSTFLILCKQCYIR